MHRKHPFIATALLCLLTACTGVGTDGSTAQRKREVETGLVGAVALDGADAPRWTIEERMRRYNVPGLSVAVLHDGRVEWTAAYALPGTPAPTPTTLFQAASISKSVAGTLAVRLAEAGRVDLDADVEPDLAPLHLPPGKQTRDNPVTLRKLLSHTAGTSVSGFPGYAPDQPIPTDAQVIAGEPPANTPRVEVVTAPGTTWAYSGGGYTVAELAIEHRLATDFARLMQDWVLTPLAMRDSTFEQPLPARFRDRFAHGHLADGHEVEGGAHVYPEQAAAGLWTTPSDLAKFVLAIRDSYRDGTRFLSHKAATSDLLAPQKNDYALGINVNGEGPALRFQHSGSNAGFKSRYVLYADSGDGLIVMSNSDNGMYVTRELFRAVARVYGWPDPQPSQERSVPFDRAALARFVGSYAYDGTPMRNSNRVDLVADGDGYALVLPDIGRVALVATGPRKLLAPETGLVVELVEENGRRRLQVGNQPASRIGA